MKAKRIIIKGKVHDEGYRLFLLTEAESLHIENFDARNVLADGKQQLVVLVGVPEGEEEKVARLIEFARTNYPPDASVLAVQVEDYPEEVRSVESFRQSFMVAQLAKIAQGGVVLLKKQDRSLEKQDETINALREESAKTREVLKEESPKMREVIKGRIEEDVEWLKSEIIEMKTTLGRVKAKVGVV